MQASNYKREPNPEIRESCTASPGFRPDYRLPGELAPTSGHYPGAF